MKKIKSNVEANLYMLQIMAEKLEAFKDRGKEDYLASNDLEDIISIIDGRPELISDIKKSNEEIKLLLYISIADCVVNSLQRQLQ